MDPTNAINALLQNQAELQAAVQELVRRTAREIPTTRAPGEVLTKLTPEDDVEAYLELFERTAARERWPVAEWGSILSSFLSGEAQRVCHELPLADARDYAKLKHAILAIKGNSLPARAQRYHNWAFHPGQPARPQVAALMRLTNNWLRGEGGIPAIDRLIIDRCIRALPPDARKYASQVSPSTVERLVELLENHQVTDEVMKSSRPAADHPKPADPRGGRERRRTAPPSPPRARDAAPDRSNRGRETKERRCYVCGKVDHISWTCPERAGRDASMPSAASDVTRPCFHTQSDSRQQYSLPIKIEGIDAQAMLDSGSAVTLVRPDLAAPPTAETVPVTCVHGDLRRYPVTYVRVQTPRGGAVVQAGVVPGLPVPFLMGYDCPLFERYWNPGLRGGPRRKPRRRRHHPRNGTPRPAYPAFRPSDEEHSSGSTPEERGPEEESDDGPEAPPGIAHSPDSAPEPDPFAEFPLPDAPSQARSGEFATQQWEDPNLQGARQQVAAVDGKLCDGVSELQPPYFVVKNNLLYRGVKLETGEIIEQLLVPRQYISRVLYLAHSHQLGAHLGVKKTMDRIMARFYWPGLKKAVEQFCRSCPECQLTAPKPTFRNPLIPLPIIDVPFSRIGMDVVGPLPKSGRGHKYILVIVDYATRYPEAIPLRAATAKAVAHELLTLFSRVGIVAEVLSDQGSCFMSQVLTLLYKWLKIKRIRTSSYHPETDGLSERYIQTIKRMLRKVADDERKDWDRLIPFIMFALREVPQASTGFSPFELLYGRSPRGLLDIAKETWETQPSPHRSVVDHIEQLQARARTIWPLVREHMEKAQQAQSRVYNRGAALREFQVGEKVLVLVPTSECKFLAKWQGPYEIIERKGPVNYKVRRPGRRKGEVIYHVNLLKKWHEPEQIPLPALLTSVSPQLSVPVPISDDLSPRQVQELKEVVMRFQDRFSEVPGRTHVLRHDIITEPGKVVRQKPYRIPEARRHAIEGEVKKMLELGVIEESCSPWSSPIVMVPKPDGSLRFCNDFRKLNEVSTFDAYPMKRVDEMLERLGSARFVSTLDLTRGYWQIALTDRAKPKTAFSTPDGLFQYTVMPFGVHGAPATFQRLMDKVLRPHRAYASAYIDDIVLFSGSWGSHLTHLEAVLGALRDAGLTANPKKCHLGLTEADYLGHTIGRGCIRPQTKKIEKIQAWPRPATKKQVKSFLGLIAYYQKFIHHFATTAAPLYALTKKSLPHHVTWTEETECAFQALKEALCTEPVLKAPDFSRPFILHTDASGTGLGAVLAQNIGGEEHPITFISRKLLDHERKYATVEKECLAIKWAVHHLRYYLWGRQFTLITDHAPLKWMSTSKDKNDRVTRWFLELQNYKFTVEHRPGRCLQHADALSRLYEEDTATGVAPGNRLGGRMCGVSIRRHRPTGKIHPREQMRQRGRRGRVIDGAYIPNRLLRQLEWEPAAWTHPNGAGGFKKQLSLSHFETALGRERS